MKMIIDVRNDKLGCWIMNIDVRNYMLRCWIIEIKLEKTFVLNFFGCYDVITVKSEIGNKNKDYVGHDPSWHVNK